MCRLEHGLHFFCWSTITEKKFHHGQIGRKTNGLFPNKNMQTIVSLREPEIDQDFFLNPISGRSR